MAEPSRQLTIPERRIPSRLDPILWRIVDSVPCHLSLLQYFDIKIALWRDFRCFSIPVLASIYRKRPQTYIAERRPWIRETARGIVMRLVVFNFGGRHSVFLLAKVSRTILIPLSTRVGGNDVVDFILSRAWGAP
jgi:hypothetical protein